MKAAGAAAVSAALLLVPACGGAAERDAANEEAVRRAGYRAAAARDFLATCRAGAGRAETRAQLARLDQLRRLSASKRIGPALWAGENEWVAVRRRSQPPACGPGEQDYRAALVRFSRSLDALAAHIRDHRE